MRCGASSRAQAWAHLLSACRDRARLLLGQLIAFVLFPAEHKIGARMSSTCSTPAFEVFRNSPLRFFVCLSIFDCFVQ